MEVQVFSQNTMARDTDPSNFKLLHLFCLSTSWGMQIWVTFVAGFVMSSHLPRRTFGFIQHKLFPYYFRIGTACALLNLTLFATHHPTELLSDEQQTQFFLFLICVDASVMNMQWFGRVTSKTVAAMHFVERSYSLDQGTRESCQWLCDSSPIYKQLSQWFTLYHALSFLCNFCCIVCNGLSLYNLAAALPVL